MFRPSFVFRGAGRGTFRRSKPLLALGTNAEVHHRVARQKPWWQTLAMVGGFLIFVNVSSLALYFGNRWYQTWRPSGNDIFVTSAIDAKLFARPDLAVAAVRMAGHHALSDAKTPFGRPMVAPRELQPEAEELFELVCQLHSEQPTFSIPDLWCIVTSKALARLGGPNVAVYRGREDAPDFVDVSKLLAFTPSLLTEDTRDILSLKRLLSRQGLTVEQIVALIGGVRNVGFHYSANFHTTEEVKPRMHRARPASDDSANAEPLPYPHTVEKCTLDPYVFGGEYFDYLLDYDWRQGRFSSKKLFRCDEKRRRRQVLLLDPFSEQASESSKRRDAARDKAQQTINDTAARTEDTLNGGDVEQSGRFGRSGEAQFLKKKKESEPQPAVEEEEAPEYVYTGGKQVEVCSEISMQAVDMMLLDDGLTKGWLHRFGNDEIEFYSIFGDLMIDIQNRGYNRNELRLPRA